MCLHLAACPPPASKVKRFVNEKVPTPEAGMKSVINIQASATGASSSNRTPNLASLSAQGQQALINKLAEGNNNFSPTFISRALATGISGPQRARTDYTRFNRRIFVTVDSLDLFSTRPADRIDTMRTTISITPQDATFLSWSTLANADRTVDIADLKFTGANSIEASLTGTGSIDGGLTAESSRELEETVRLRASQIRLFGGVKGHEAFIAERGAPLVDLGGFRSIDVTVQVEQDTTRYLTVSGYNGSDSNKPLISVSNVTLPANTGTVCNGITTKAKVEGTIRKVNSGYRTWNEGDDEISFETFSASADFSLIPKEVLQTHFVVIRDSTTKTSLNIRPATETSSELLQFANYELASNFLFSARNGKVPSTDGYFIELQKVPAGQTQPSLNTIWFQNATIEFSKLGCP